MMVFAFVTTSFIMLAAISFAITEAIQCFCYSKSSSHGSIVRFYIQPLNKQYLTYAVMEQMESTKKDR